MKKIIEIFGWGLTKILRCTNYAVKVYKKTHFRRIGHNVYIGNNCTLTEENISIGNNVSIGSFCCFQSVHGNIEIGSNVLFGPNVHIHGGNHSIDRIGYLINEDGLKAKGEDGLIVIEDDCWIGACSIILKNVRIGRGSIIGAGSVVTKNVPQYSIYTGVPSQKTRQRFTSEETVVHEDILKQRNLM